MSPWIDRLRSRTVGAGAVFVRPLHRRSHAVRFGNVLDSAGSVVPLLRNQIERGGPVTFVGLRPGEKLYDEIFSDFEDQAETAHPKIRVALQGVAPTPGQLAAKLAALEAAVSICDEVAMRAVLDDILSRWRSAGGGRKIGTLPEMREVANG